MNQNNEKRLEYSTKQLNYKKFLIFLHLTYKGLITMQNIWSETLDGYPDTNIICGSHAFHAIENLLHQLKPNSIVVFTGRQSADITGAWRKLNKSFTYPHVTAYRFAEIEPEPSSDTVNRMVEFLNDKCPDEVIAMGGGSVLDAAKSAWAVYQIQTPLEKLFGSNKISAIQQHLKKVICIPTTSGTGSEATPYANIIDHANSVKRLIADSELIPEYSFLCPELTNFMPEHVTIATACDAMAHSMEGFLNVQQDNAHPSANTWALQSIKLITENLPLVIRNPDNIEARTALSVAACLGGMVIRYKSTGLPHLCSFSWFGKIEHGIAVSILLPYALDYYIQSPAIQQRVMELQSLFPGNSPEAIINSYRNFLTACGVPTSLKAFPDITEELLETTARSAGQNKMKLDLAPKPVPIDKSFEILSAILRAAFI